MDKNQQVKDFLDLSENWKKLIFLANNNSTMLISAYCNLKRDSSLSFDSYIIQTNT